MKKFIAVILSSFMLFAGCYAADSVGFIDLTNMEVGGDGISVDGNVVTITGGGVFTVTGTLNDGMIYINSDSEVELQLNGANITNSSGPAVFFENSRKSVITLNENTVNTLCDGSSYSNDAKAALFSNDDLEIKGTGTLKITSNYNHGITGDDDLIVKGGNIKISAVGDGLHANDLISISDAVIEITAQDDGVQSEAEFLMESGSLSISADDKGITAAGNLTVNGGSITVSKATEAMESEAVMTINDGEINLTCSDDGMNAGGTNSGKQNMGDKKIQMPDGEQVSDKGKMPGGNQNPEDGRNFDRKELPEDRPMPDNGQFPGKGRREEGNENEGVRPDIPPEGKIPDSSEAEGRPVAGGGRMPGMGNTQNDESHSIVINGGTIQICAGGDGLDSNGSLYIKGGEIVIESSEGAGDGSLDCDGTFEITGGTLVALGSAGMVQIPQNASEQNIIKVIFDTAQSAGSTVYLKDGEGNSLLEYTASKGYQSLVASSENIKTGESYSVYVDDVKKYDITVSETVSSADSSAFGGRGNRGNMPQRGETEERNRQINILINGNQMSFKEQGPVIYGGTTLAPLRELMEALGAEVGWDGNTNSVSIKLGENLLTLTIDSKAAEKNSEKLTLAQAPVLLNDKTMVPVRFITESFGMNVDWDDLSSTVTISE